jgi:hypothetical protein
MCSVDEDRLLHSSSREHPQSRYSRSKNGPCRRAVCQTRRRRRRSRFPVKPPPLASSALDRNKLNHARCGGREVSDRSCCDERSLQGHLHALVNKDDLVMPGHLAARHGRGPFDPTTGMLYVNVNELGCSGYMQKQPEGSAVCVPASESMHAASSLASDGTGRIEHGAPTMGGSIVRPLALNSRAGVRIQPRRSDVLVAFAITEAGTTPYRNSERQHTASDRGYGPQSRAGTADPR